MLLRRGLLAGGGTGCWGASHQPAVYLGHSLHTLGRAARLTRLHPLTCAGFQAHWPLLTNEDGQRNPADDLLGTREGGQALFRFIRATKAYTAQAGPADDLVSLADADDTDDDEDE